MKRYYKHLVIHEDIIVEAGNKKMAQKIYEETPLLNYDPPIGVTFTGELVDEETEWKELGR